MSKLEQISLNDANISPESVHAFLDRVQDASIELHSFMIMRHGKVAVEGYYHPYNQYTPHVMFSFSKSLVSTAIGFLVQEGNLSLNEKLVDIFPDDLPEVVSENLKKADVKSLLTMSCGHETEISFDEQNCKTWIKNFLSHEFKYEPGTMFQYNTAGTNMLSAIVQKKAGCTLTEYLTPRLYEPLGMTDVTCTVLPDGVERGGSGMRMKLTDMARFIQFYLDEGMHDGKQLLDPNWIVEASKKQIGTVNDVFPNHDSNWELGYGYQFWRCIPENIYRADGAYGQFGIVIPEKDAVIIIQSASLDPDLLLNIIWDTLLPGISEKSLDISEESEKMLNNRLKFLSLPVLHGIRNRSIEAKISGNTYKVETEYSLEDLIGGVGIWMDHTMPLQQMKFSFDEENMKIEVIEGSRIGTLLVPLTGKFQEQHLFSMNLSSSGKWLSESLFEMEVRNMISATGARIFLEFTNDKIILRQMSTMPSTWRIDEDFNRGTIEFTLV